MGLDTLSVAYAPDSSSAPTYYGGSGSNTGYGEQSYACRNGITFQFKHRHRARRSLQVTVAVGDGSATPTATGLVTLISGAYSSTAVTLLNGDCLIVIPAGSLAAGFDI